jgi:hypothetical protein
MVLACMLIIHEEYLEKSIILFALSLNFDTTLCRFVRYSSHTVDFHCLEFCYVLHSVCISLTTHCVQTDILSSRSCGSYETRNRT